MPADVNLNIDVSKKGEGDKEAAVGLEALAKAADNASDQLSQLDRKLLETRAAMIAAGKTFQQTGDISPLKALLKDERQLSTVQKSVERGAKAIAQDLENAGDQGGQGFVTRFASRVESGLGRLSGTAPEGLVQWLVAGAVAAAPLIGAAIDAGVLLGVGGAGIAAGLAGAAQDKQVRAAYVDLGMFAKQQLVDASTGYVGPAIVAASQLKSALGRIGPAFKSDLDAVAPSLNHLVDGLAGFIEEMQAHGLGDAFKAAKPVIDALAQELPQMGAAMGGFFRDMAAGGPGAVQFIHDFSAGIQVTLANIGLLVEGMSKLYDFLRNTRIGEWLTGPLVAMFDKLQEGGNKSTKTLAELNAEGYQASLALDRAGQAARTVGLGAMVSAEDFKNLSAQISSTAATSDVLAGKLTDRVVNGMLALDQASLGMNQALLAVHESFVQNGKQLDIVTAKGEANRSAVLSAVSANLQQYDALVQSGVGAQDAAAAYDQNTAALESQLRKAHLTQGEIDGLIGKYKNVPANVNTQIAIQGLADAINNLDTTLRLINGLHDKTVTVTTYFNSVGTPAAGAPGGLRSVPRAFAYGGVVEHAASGLLKDAQTFSAAASGALYAFAEPRTGGEAFIPKHGDLDRSRAIWSYVGQNWLGMGGRGRYGGAPIAAAGPSRGAPQQLTVRFAGNTDSAFATAFMRLVRQGDIQLG